MWIWAKVHQGQKCSATPAVPQGEHRESAVPRKLTTRSHPWIQAIAHSHCAFTQPFIIPILFGHLVQWVGRISEGSYHSRRLRCWAQTSVTAGSVNPVFPGSASSSSHVSASQRAFKRLKGKQEAAKSCVISWSSPPHQAFAGCVVWDTAPNITLLCLSPWSPSQERCKELPWAHTSQQLLLKPNKTEGRVNLKANAGCHGEFPNTLWVT